MFHWSQSLKQDETDNIKGFPRVWLFIKVNFCIDPMSLLQKAIELPHHYFPEKKIRFIQPPTVSSHSGNLLFYLHWFEKIKKII